jgi:hypothetical protein
LEQCLEEHDFTPKYQFDEDLAKQDKLATWIEYLCYELCQYDRHIRIVQAKRAKRDEAWKQLVDPWVLKPGQTEVPIHTSSLEFNLKTEMFAAEQTMKSAEAALKVGKNSQCSDEQYTKLKDVALARLKDAKAWLESVKRRSDLALKFIKGTEDYDSANEDATRHSGLLKWIRGQIPIIEAELRGPNASESTSHMEKGTSSPIRRDFAYESLEIPKVTRYNEDNQTVSPIDDIISSKLQRGTSKSDRTSNNTDVERPLKRFKSDVTVIQVPQGTEIVTNTTAGRPIGPPEDLQHSAASQQPFVTVLELRLVKNDPKLSYRLLPTQSKPRPTNHLGRRYPLPCPNPR